MLHTFTSSPIQLCQCFRWGLGLWEVWLQQLCPAQWMLPLQCQEARVRGERKKNKSRTGSAKDERKTQIWPVESWLYNRKLEKRVEERKLRQLRQDPEKWQYAVMPMFFCMIFWFRCYSLSIGAKSDCVRGEDQLKGSELATCHRIFGKKCARLRWVGNLAVVKWFCVETWAFWRGTKRISNDIKCAMLYPFPVTEKNM